MDEKPVLEYKAGNDGRRVRNRVAAAASKVSVALFVLFAVVAAIVLIWDPVSKRLVDPEGVNQFFPACNGLGILAAIIAIVLGKPFPGWLMIILHILGFVLMPSFGLA